jgi:hypothetical protein
MLFKSLFIQYWKSFATFNFIDRRLFNFKRSLSRLRGVKSVKICSIFLKNTALTAHTFIKIGTIKSSSIFLENIWRWILNSFLTWSAQVWTCCLCSLKNLTLRKLLIRFFILFKCYLWLCDLRSRLWSSFIYLGRSIFLANLAYKMI